MTFKITTITLTPDAWPGALGVSLLGSGLKDGRWALETIDLRDFGYGKHNMVDDTCAGGGAGMVIKPDVAINAVKSIDIGTRPVIYLTPRGKPLNQKKVRELSKADGMVLFCGRFEGLDQRAIDILQMDEISVGDFVLMGGDIAAQAMCEAVLRLIDGMMGKAESHENESFENGLLEHPLYTRPREIEGHAIPEVLLSGNHSAIEKWKLQKSEEVTKERRPDLWEKYKQSD